MALVIVILTAVNLWKLVSKFAQVYSLGGFADGLYTRSFVTVCFEPYLTPSNRSVQPEATPVGV